MANMDEWLVIPYLNFNWAVDTMGTIVFFPPQSQTKIDNAVENEVRNRRERLCVFPHGILLTCVIVAVMHV